MNERRVEISGGVSHNPLPIEELVIVASEGTPGLRIVETDFRAQIRVAASERIVVGLEYLDGPNQLSVENVFGVPPAPNKNVRGAGPSLAYVWASENTAVTVGVGVSTIVIRIPWERWQLWDTDCGSCGWGAYRKIQSETATSVKYRLTVLPSFRIVDGLLGYFGFSLQNGFINNGFEYANNDESTLERDFGIVLQFGARYRLEPVFFDLAAWVPAGYDRYSGVRRPGLHFGLGTSLFEK